MLLRFGIRGTTPLIMHSAGGVDTTTEIALEIAAINAKKGSNLTASDTARRKELETEQSLWLTEEGNPTVPVSAVRAVIETGARKRRQGPQVREGLVVLRTDFSFDREKYGETMDDWRKKMQFTVPVFLNRKRVMRTRAKMDNWSVKIVVEVDEELVDAGQLAEWLDIAGRRIGLGDWRPEKSGTYGRFALDGEIEEVGEDALD